jgi:predicted dehydrogenase
LAVRIYRIGVIGCGLIGGRRALTAAAHERTTVAAVVDTDPERAEALAGEIRQVVGAAGVAATRVVAGGAGSGAREAGGGAGVVVHRDWRRVVEDPAIDAVVVATPNGYLAEIGEAALAAGKSVLLEKPMGRNLEEAERLAAAEAAAGGAGEERGPVLKIGFNHRYHPALAGLLEAVRGGEIGRVIGIRGRYGHGGRPGCELEWRGDPELAGGGHLLDQGVHLADLIHGVAGLPSRGVAFLQTAIWPLGPLEDNAYGTFQFSDGVIAQLHVSMTQWKNLFSFEVTGEAGAVVVEGWGGSYGEERLVRIRRRFEGGVPEVSEESFPGPDQSWSLEWEDFVEALYTGRPRHGGVEDGLAAMRIVDALYRSGASGRIEEVLAGDCGGVSAG